MSRMLRRPRCTSWNGVCPRKSPLEPYGPDCSVITTHTQSKRVFSTVPLQQRLSPQSECPSKLDQDVPSCLALNSTGHMQGRSCDPSPVEFGVPKIAPWSSVGWGGVQSTLEYSNTPTPHCALLKGHR